MLWYQRLSTKLAVTVLAIIGILVIVSGLLGTTFINNGFKKDAREINRVQAALLQQELTTINDLMQQQARSAMLVLKDKSLEKGAPSLGKMIKVGEKNVPDLVFGETGQATYHKQITLGDRETVDYTVVSR